VGGKVTSAKYPLRKNRKNKDKGTGATRGQDPLYHKPSWGWGKKEWSAHSLKVPNCEEEEKKEARRKHAKSTAGKNGLSGKSEENKGKGTFKRL